MNAKKLTLLEIMTYATNIRLSMLSGHHQQQLREILDSVGVPLAPAGRGGSGVVVKFINDSSGTSAVRSRSVTPSRVGSRGRSSARSKTPDASLRNRSLDASRLNDISSEFSAVFNPNSFKHISMWQFKPMSVSIMSSRVEELLSAITDTLRRSNALAPIDLSPVLFRYFQERLGLRSLVEFNFLDLLGNIMDHRKSVMEVDIFARILNGFYDPVDVMFYEYAKRHVRGHASGSKMLTLRDCEEVTRKIFGQEQAVVGDTVLSTLQEELDGLPGQVRDSATTTINVSYFEYISLWVFHHQRLEPDVRDSLNQFANILRESLSVIGEAPGNLIDSYIDSIIQLKNQTRLELEKPPLSELPAQETDELGLMVAQVLQRACERKLGKSPDPSCVGQADRLLQAVMNEDLSAWIKEGSTPIEFNRAAFARDQLLRSVESDLPDVERKLAAFCDQIVESGGVGGPVRSYS